MPHGVFAYDELSYPEVAALPRWVPLVIPLGEGYDLAELARLLGSPPALGMLPALPYGWQGSRLAVPPAIFDPLLANLADNLREDGFQRVFVLMPPGITCGLGGMEVRLPSTDPVEALPPASELGKVILLPVGHTEQHGHHLPLNVDSVLIEAVSRGAQAQAPGKAFSLPVFPYGVSTHRRAFAGTMNVGGRVFEDFWLAVVDNLVLRGFQTLYLLSGHGGNCSFLTNVVKYAGERFPGSFIATAWLYLSGPQGVRALEKYRRSPAWDMPVSWKPP